MLSHFHIVTLYYVDTLNDTLMTSEMRRSSIISADNILNIESLRKLIISKLSIWFTRNWCNKCSKKSLGTQYISKKQSSAYISKLVSAYSVELWMQKLLSRFRTVFLCALILCSALQFILQRRLSGISILYLYFWLNAVLCLRYLYIFILLLWRD